MAAMFASPETQTLQTDGKMELIAFVEHRETNNPQYRRQVHNCHGSKQKLALEFGHQRFTQAF